MSTPNPHPTLLDGTQILQRSFDEDNDQLRVNASFTGSIGTVECIITNNSDSIALGTSTDLFTSTNNSGKISLDVNISNSNIPVSIVSVPPVSQSTEFIYTERNNIASGINQQIGVYTVPSNTKTIVQRVFVSGDNIAKYQVRYNGNIVATKRTYYSGLNEVFEFLQSLNNGFLMSPGDILSVTALQTISLSSTNFESTLQILELT